jgi:dimethylargininase
LGAGEDLQGPADGLAKPTVMNYTRAMVKKPGRSLTRGLSTAGLGLPEYKKALIQHREYINALEECGLQVRILEADERFPDCTFLEDVALLTPRCAIVLNPGAPSRKGETEGIDQILADYYQEVRRIQGPGTVEGGDILQVEDHYYIGLTARTNQAGAEEVIAILEEFGFRASTVPVRGLLHLKTGVAYLDQGRMIAVPEFIRQGIFQGHTLLEISPEENYAANCLCLNGKVILPEGCPSTEKVIGEMGYPIRKVDTSEFRKLDGGLSCLSLRF